VPSAQSAATVNSIVKIVEPSAATLLSPLGVANASLSRPFTTVSAPYASPLVSALYAILLPALSYEIPPSKPDTARASPLTITFIVTFSPGAASTSGIIHSISPC